MSQEQLDTVIGIMRSGAGPDLSRPAEESRAKFDAMLEAMPAPEGVDFERGELGGVPVVWSRTAGAAEGNVLLYLHGGAYVIGNSWGYRALWSALARACGARGVGVDYRLAPEHPYPAAIEDAVAAYRALLATGIRPRAVVMAGDSAGGGLVVATLVEARRQGLPMPGSALLISPWADMACTAGTIESKRDEDPALTVEGLRICAGQYLAGQPLDTPLASPVHADLTGLPPLMIQVGSAEILMDDAVRLAGRAGAAGVMTRLEIWSGMPHVWHAFGFMLDEGRAAIDLAAGYLVAHMEK